MICVVSPTRASVGEHHGRVVQARAEPDVFVGGQAAGVLVQRDQGGRFRGQHFVVRRVHAVGGRQVGERAVDQHRTTRRIVRPDAQVVDQVAAPNDVGVRRVQLHGGRVRPGDVLPLVDEGPVVAVRQSVGIQAYDFRGTGHHVHAIALDGRRRADAQVLVAIQKSGGHLGPLRHDQPPEQLAGGLVEALDQPAASPLQPLVARQVQVVGPDVHAAVGHGGIAVGRRTEFDDPFDVLSALRVDPAFAFPRAARKRLRQPGFVRHHVPLAAPTPLRPIGGVR